MRKEPVRKDPVRKDPVRKHCVMKNTSKPLWPLTLLVLFAAGGLACGSRNSLTRSHGESTRAHFAAQVATPEAGERKQKLAGLDTQDAKVIVQGYRGRMGGKFGVAPASPGFLIVSPEGAAHAPAMPPPSVPQ